MVGAEQPAPVEPDRANAAAVGWHGHPDDFDVPPPQPAPRPVETVRLRGDRL